MNELKDIAKRIFNVSGKSDFDNLSLEIFRYQYKNVEIYRKYSDLIGRPESRVLEVSDIPYLPIEFFKTEKIICQGLTEQKIFKSSGTGQSGRSSHYVADLSIYKHSYLETFRKFVGNPTDYTFFTLLPSYRENSESSLLFMVEGLLEQSGKFISEKSPETTFNELLNHNKAGKKCILFGVSFALLDLAERFGQSLPNTTIIETGGMKGKRKEITRDELHHILQIRLRPEKIISEYGMTELLSQAYTVDGSRFITPPWMRVSIRDPHDPLSVKNSGTGAINIIDLCNVYSCSFLSTADLGKIHGDGSFEVLGRFDHSDIRGCNLMYGQD